MRLYDITELSVCVVCLHLLANGEYDDGTDAAEKCAEGQAKIWGDDAQHLTLGGEELGFSWQDCDGCGDTDGGDRFRVNLMIPTLAALFKVGQRVESHPATDAWISGDRYGNVAKIGRKYVHVKMDRSGRTLKFGPKNVLHVPA